MKKKLNLLATTKTIKNSEVMMLMLKTCLCIYGVGAVRFGFRLFGSCSSGLVMDW